MSSFISRPHEFWRVNSYSYPSFFSDGIKAKESWDTFLSFFNFTNYDEIKNYWNTGSAPRKLNPSALESWKATFEELGLLYVISRSNQITITPAGEKLRKLAESEDEIEFVWTGVNLLTRYPLKGPRRARNELHGNSDLFLYRFFFSAILELNNYIWWSEFERILCRVFNTSDAALAVDEIKMLRKDPSLINELTLPAVQRRGAFYNSLNQVANHASMNHLILKTDRDASPYANFIDGEPNKKIVLKEEWRGIVKKALNLKITSGLCGFSGSYSQALPSCPSFSSEEEYFNFLGAEVVDLASVTHVDLKSIEILGEQVHYLNDGEHYFEDGANSIIGKQTTLCQLSIGQRLILSSNTHWTFRIVKKEVIDHETVKIFMQQARPISDFSLIEKLIGDDNG